MRIGDHVTIGGRHYVVRGFDPMSVPERRVDLEDLETGEHVRLPLEELENAGD